MDLRNGSITLGELLANPQANAVLQRRFGSLLSHPMLGSAKKLSLKQVVQLSAGKIPKDVVDATLQELKNIPND